MHSLYTTTASASSSSWARPCPSCASFPSCPSAAPASARGLASPSGGCVSSAYIQGPFEAVPRLGARARRRRRVRVRGAWRLPRHVQAACNGRCGKQGERTQAERPLARHQRRYAHELARHAGALRGAQELAVQAHAVVRRPCHLDQLRRALVHTLGRRLRRDQHVVRVVTRHLDRGQDAVLASERLAWDRHAIEARGIDAFRHTDDPQLLVAHRAHIVQAARAVANRWRKRRRSGTAAVRARHRRASRARFFSGGGPSLPHGATRRARWAAGPVGAALRGAAARPARGQAACGR